MALEQPCAFQLVVVPVELVDRIVVPDREFQRIAIVDKIGDQIQLTQAVFDVLGRVVAASRGGVQGAKIVIPIIHLRRRAVGKVA